MNWQRIQVALGWLVSESMRSAHRRIVAVGLLVGLVYSPFWLYDVFVGTAAGAASLLLVFALVLGGYLLWQQRYSLTRIQVSADDRWLGHLIAIIGIGLVPFCSFAEWSQRLLFMVILIGIAISSWGLEFFKLCSIPVFLIGMGLFPKPGTLADLLWQTFLPQNFLEQLMAWGGAIGLKAIGQPAVLDGATIFLPGGAVKVAWGCNGFYMALTLATASILLGLFLKQKVSKVILLVVIGVIVAWLGNVPRIMLMAMADAYWGKSAFEFWHGPWGGQIFSTILLTIYYYIAMAIVKQKPAKLLSSK